MKTLALAFAVLSLAACGGSSDPLDTLSSPRTTVPPPLVGEWFTGTLSSIQYYDRTTGAFQNPNGSGFYFIFRDDGGYETGAVIDSTVGACTLRLLGSEFGTVTVSGQSLTAYRHTITVQTTNTCGNDGTRTQGEESRVLSWSVDLDADGREWLSLVHADGAIEKYRRWQ